MRAVEITAYGAPDVLRMGERASVQAGVGEVLIRVAASGVNRPDVLQRTGNYPVPPGASDIPGLEVAGEIIAGDAAAMAAAGFKLGDRVCALVAGGGYAELCVAPVGQCLPVPKGLSDIEAASLPETFFTVWSNVFDRVRLQACGFERLFDLGDGAYFQRHTSFGGRDLHRRCLAKHIGQGIQAANKNGDRKDHILPQGITVHGQAARTVRGMR
jgi:NADPH:quinone reductase-like Zn-dependent oxidoreductase